MQSQKIITAIAAAGMLLSSIPVQAESVQYILMLPLSDGTSYGIDMEYLSEEFSSDQYDILLYEAGEQVEFSIDSDHDYSIVYAEDESAFEYTEDDDEISFTMPEDDLKLVLGNLIETEAAESGETNSSDENVESQKGTIAVRLYGDISASITLVNGNSANIESGGLYSGTDKIDLISVSSENGYTAAPEIRVYKDGVQTDNSIILSSGTSGNTFTVDLANTIELDGDYVVMIIQDGYSGITDISSYETLTLPEETSVDSESVEDNQDEIEESLTETQMEASETESSAGIEESETETIETGISVSIDNNMTASVEMVDGTTNAIEAGGTFTTVNNIDLIRISFENGYTEDPSVSITKDGADASDIIVNKGGNGTVYTVDLSNSMEIDGNYEIVISDAETESEGNIPAEAEKSTNTEISLSLSENGSDTEIQGTNSSEGSSADYETETDSAETEKIETTITVVGAGVHGVSTSSSSAIANENLGVSSGLSSEESTSVNTGIKATATVSLDNGYVFEISDSEEHTTTMRVLSINIQSEEKLQNIPDIKIYKEGELVNSHDLIISRSGSGNEYTIEFNENGLEVGYDIVISIPR